MVTYNKDTDPDLNSYKLMGVENRDLWIEAGLEESLAEGMRRHNVIYGSFGVQIIKWDMRADLDKFDVEDYMREITCDEYIIYDERLEKKRKRKVKILQ